jgi:VanZ family protein
MRLWAPVVVYMGAIFFVSSLSNPPVPPTTDKPLHWLAYLGLAVVVVRALAGGLPRRIGFGILLPAMLITVAYGATDEVHQLFVPGRTGDVYDLMADGAGALAGTVACTLWGIISPSSRDGL